MRSFIRSLPLWLPAACPSAPVMGSTFTSYALTAHFGTWLTDPRSGKPRWQVALELLYGQVRKAYRHRRLARAEADAFLGDLEAMAGRYAMALEYLLSAKTNAERLDDGSALVTLSRVYSYLGVVYIKLSEFDTAIGYIDQAIECDRKRGNEVGPLYDLMNRATALTLAGRYDEGYRDSRKGLEAAEKLRNTYLIAGLAACVAEACHGLQRWDEAERYATYALNQEEEFFRAPTLLVLGRIRLGQEKYDECIGLLTAARDSAQQIEDRNTEASIWECLGVAHLRQGSPDAARSAFETALRIYAELNLPGEINRLQAQLQGLP